MRQALDVVQCDVAVVVEIEMPEELGSARTRFGGSESMPKGVKGESCLRKCPNGKAYVAYPK